MNKNAMLLLLLGIGALYLYEKSQTPVSTGGVPGPFVGPCPSPYIQTNTGCQMPPSTLPPSQQPGFVGPLPPDPIQQLLNEI